MNKALYMAYAALEAEKVVIEEKQANIKKDILTELQGLPEGKNGVEIDAGSFTLQKKPAYAYSKVIDDMALNLENRKKQEIAMGIAKIKSTTEYVVYRAIKKIA